MPNILLRGGGDRLYPSLRVDHKWHSKSDGHQQQLPSQNKIRNKKYIYRIYSSYIVRIYLSTRSRSVGYTQKRGRAPPSITFYKHRAFQKSQCRPSPDVSARAGLRRQSVPTLAVRRLIEQLFLFIFLLIFFLFRAVLCIQTQHHVYIIECQILIIINFSRFPPLDGLMMSIENKRTHTPSLPSSSSPVSS